MSMIAVGRRYSMYLHCIRSRHEKNSTSRDMNSPACDWIDTGGLRVLAISLRRVKTSGKSGIHGRARREERSENARKFLQLSARSPSAAIFRLRWLHWLGKPTRGNLLDSPPTNMPQEIPRVFSQRSRSLLSSLGQSFSPALSLFPFSTPFRRYSRFTCNPFLCDPFPRRSRP